MKKLVIAALIAGGMALPLFSSAQGNQRFIEVTGEAEIVIDPDEITIEFILEATEEKSGKKEKIEDFEKSVKAYLKKKDIGTERLKPLTINTDITASHTTVSKHYSLLLYGPDEVRQVMAALDTLGATHKRIIKMQSKKEAHYRIQVQTIALMNAKEKATSMLAVFNEKPGRVLEIKDAPDAAYDYLMGSYMKSIEETFLTATDELKIKIAYRVRVKFEIS